ncbi:RNA-binding (RRM/RBD/RNP motifs) family protein [Actinidia rufa]|uniref:RNA-binding (RRM/RBD/RNP motifs) family protein n=1 Tax=Actinidia rufa TaxID=165716 RepID=A0A7J0E8H2_9ERIC|nr:RNA-binding (RRM/RBD/RNP motifs) family protein [Actinidia rufa]
MKSNIHGKLRLRGPYQERNNRLPPGMETLAMLETLKVAEVTGPIIYDQNTQRPRGFGFISFDTEDAVDRVLRKTFHDLSGKQVEVKHALPKDANPGGVAGHSMGGGLRIYGGANLGCGGATGNAYGNPNILNTGYGSGPRHSWSSQVPSGYGAVDYGNSGSKGLDVEPISAYDGIGGHARSVPNSNAPAAGGDLQGNGGGYMGGSYSDATGMKVMYKDGFSRVSWKEGWLLLDVMHTLGLVGLLDSQ